MKPILFNTDMVRAILKNRKTMTRQVVKPQPRMGVRLEYDEGYGEWIYKSGCAMLHGIAKMPCEPGDILYVRETWARMDGDFDPIWFEEPALLRNGQIIYRAEHPEFSECRWRPSIHMPREAARIFLRVTDVRAERLQDINAAGALAEGCDGRCEGPQDGALSDCQKNYDFSIEKFQTVWDSTLKPADRALYGWDANPWVWVIEFERCERPEGD